MCDLHVLGASQLVLCWEGCDPFPSAHRYLHVACPHNIGVGVTKPKSAIIIFPTLEHLSKQWLTIEYHVHIWQVSSLLRWDDAHQIHMWFRGSHRSFYKIKKIPNWKINEQNFSKPQPWPTQAATRAHHWTAFYWEDSRVGSESERPQLWSHGWCLARCLYVCI